MFEDETQNPDSPERVDVVAVGSGLAGLVAARELLGAGLSVLVLEARERVGAGAPAHGGVEESPVLRLRAVFSSLAFVALIGACL